MNAHERGFLEFLAEPGRRRMRTLLEMGEKRRREVRSLLDHAVGLDLRYHEHLQGNLSLAPAVEELLRRRDAPDFCYVMSANPDWDEREMPLCEALQAICGSGHGSFISCIPGRLGYFEYEEPNSAYLLSR